MVSSKNQLCPTFDKTGSCKFGELCWYSHDKERFAGLPRQPPPVCERWRKHGTCQFNATSCWYSHPEHLRGSAAKLKRKRSRSPANERAQPAAALAPVTADREFGDAPQLGQHSSQEMATYIQQHSDNVEVRLAKHHALRLDTLTEHLCEVLFRAPVHKADVFCAYHNVLSFTASAAGVGGAGRLAIS
jgi:Zinc finger C-x8-C-x5-C-x3-H type (and similar)